MQPTTYDYHSDGPRNARDFERNLDLFVEVASNVSNLDGTKQRILDVDVDIAIVGLEVNEAMELFETL